MVRVGLGTSWAFETEGSFKIGDVTAVLLEPLPINPVVFAPFQKPLQPLHGTTHIATAATDANTINQRMKRSCSFT